MSADRSPSPGLLEVLADAYHQWQYGDNGTHDTLMEAAQVAETMQTALGNYLDLLVQFLIESDAVAHVEGGKELLDPDGEWQDCTWLAVTTTHSDETTVQP